MIITQNTRKTDTRHDNERTIESQSVLALPWSGFEPTSPRQTTTTTTTTTSTSTQQFATSAISLDAVELLHPSRTGNKQTPAPPPLSRPLPPPPLPCSRVVYEKKLFRGGGGDDGKMKLSCMKRNYSVAVVVMMKR